MAAAGDTYAVGPTSLTNNSTLDLKPTGTEGIVVTTLSCPEGSAWELYFRDGTNTIKVDHDAAVGRDNLSKHATASIYYQLKNVSGATAFFGADGLYTHA